VIDALWIPRYLRETAERDAAKGRHAEGFAEWVASLPGVVGELTEHWQLRPGEPYQPGGQCSWVAPARGSSGDALVVKIGWRHAEAEHEADGDAAVRVRAARTFDSTNALLLERCVPGTPLAEVVAEPERDEIVAGLLRRLWIEPPAGHPFRPLADMCRMWTAEFDAKLRRLEAGRIDAGHAREAVALFELLPATATREALLCTDLHAENILAARRQPWLVIDPKPYVGDVTYDVLQHMLNCDGRLHADPAGFADRMAALLDLDPGRLRSWLFARCVIEAPEWPSLYPVAVRLAP
jgi:streptomycin 6-kinase